MAAGGEQLPYYPEQDPDRLARLLWHEVRLAEECIGAYPWEEVPAIAPGWGRDTVTAVAFQRARTILQAISYGRTQYWEPTFELDMHMDAETFGDKPEVYRAATARLLQLVALSRVPVDPYDTYPIPNLEAIRKVLGEMRTELGVTEERERLARGPQWSVPAFPGIDHERIVQAILDGHLGIGNPNQPHVTFSTEAEQPAAAPPASGQVSSAESMDEIIRRIIDTMGDGT